MEFPWQVTYADGSGNHYTFSCASPDESAHFTYAPVTPERSSSGIYSGGQPAAGQLTGAQTQTLWNHLRRLHADTGHHAAHRAMGTGAVWWQTPTDERRFLIDSAAARSWRPFLDQLRAGS